MLVFDQPCFQSICITQDGGRCGRIHVGGSGVRGGSSPGKAVISGISIVVFVLAVFVLSLSHKPLTGLIFSVHVLLDSEELVIWRTFPGDLAHAPLRASTPMEYQFSSLDKVFLFSWLLDFLVGDKYICSDGVVADARVGAEVLQVLREGVHRSLDLRRQTADLEEAEARRCEYCWWCWRCGGPLCDG